MILSSLLRRLAPVLFLLATWSTCSLAQYRAPVAGRPYQLGVGDVIQLSVWQQPELDRELTVRDDGKIVVPLVGEIMAAGSTVPELEDLVARRLRSFNRDITEVSLTVTRYRSLQIYVMGAVSDPGLHSFESIPNVWDAIRAAGGPQTSANLRRVRVLHTAQGGMVSTIVNVEPVLRGETVADLPELEPGDTVIVPDDTVLSAADRESGVQVLGEVVSPGFYPVDGPTPLLTMVLMAGGFSRDGDPSKVRAVHDSGRGHLESRTVDTKLFVENGQVSGNPLVYAGDTIFVERRPLSGNVLRVLPTVLATVTSLVALYITLSND